jgi:ribosome modulation factor
MTDQQPRAGVEVDLKRIGCPYKPTDPRCTIWLEGYRKGTTDTFATVKSAMVGGWQ